MLSHAYDLVRPQEVLDVVEHHLPAVLKAVAKLRD
ncbi:MAG: hypothetical protein ACYDBQ_09605 [Thermoplasmatota archaeon]